MKLYLNFNEAAVFGEGTWEDYSLAILDEGFSRKSCVGAKGKAETQSVQLQLKAVCGVTNVALKILSASANVRARLTLDDGTPYFIGTIRPLSKLSVDSYMKPISIEILDDSYYLEYSMTQQADTLQSSDLKICGTSRANSLIHWLVSLCEAWNGSYDGNSNKVYASVFSDSDLLIDSAVDATIETKGITVEVGNKISDILDQLCYEYALQYRFNEQGKMLIMPSLPAENSDLSGAPVLSDSSIRLSLAIDRGDDIGHGAIVNYCKSYKGRCKVAVHNALDTRYADDKTFGRGYEWLNNGETWPPARLDSDGVSYQESKLSDTDLDNSTRQILKYDLATLKAVIEFADGSRCISQGIASFAAAADGRYRFVINAIKYKTLVKSLYLTCECWYIDTTGEEPLRTAYAMDPETCTASYIHDVEDATKLLKALSLRGDAGAVTYTFNAFAASMFVPGKILKLTSSASGLTSYIRIRSVTDHGDSRSQPLVQVVAEGFVPLSSIVIDPVSSVAKAIAQRPNDYLKLTASAPSVTLGAELELLASGYAVDTLDASLSWYLNGTLQDWTGDSVTVTTNNSWIVGDNVIRVVAAKTEAALATEAAGIVKQAAADDQDVQKDYEDCLAKIEKASDSGNFDDILAIARQQAKKAKELQENAKKRE